MKKYDVMHDDGKYVVQLVAGFVRLNKGKFNTKKEAEDWVNFLDKIDSARIVIDNSIKSLWKKLEISRSTFKGLVTEILDEL